MTNGKKKPWWERFVPDMLLNILTTAAMNRMGGGQPVARQGQQQGQPGQGQAPATGQATTPQPAENKLVKWLFATFHFLSKDDEVEWASRIRAAGVTVGVGDEELEYFLATADEQGYDRDSFRIMIVGMRRDDAIDIIEDIALLTNDAECQAMLDLMVTSKLMSKKKWPKKVWQWAKEHPFMAALAILVIIIYGLLFFKSIAMLVWHWISD